MGPSGLIALLAGWFTTEVGRQPWVVHGVMRTTDAVANHSFQQLSVTLVMFVVVYFALFGTGLAYMMRLVRKGPQVHADHAPHGGPGQSRTPARPLSAADEEN
jgi:cytochrome d ubiquinol oxidase subunit I